MKNNANQDSTFNQAENRNLPTILQS